MIAHNVRLAWAIQGKGSKRGREKRERERKEKKKRKEKRREGKRKERKGGLGRKEGGGEGGHSSRQSNKI